MTTTQRIALRLSEVRTRLNEIAGLEGDAFTPEIREEAEKLQREYADLETRQRAAIVAGGEAETRAVNDGEGAEIRQLVTRASLGAFLDGAAREIDADGAEKELREALKLGGNEVPLDFLLPPVEERADVTTTVAESIATSQSSIATRVFAATAGAYLGVQRPTVGPGDHSYVTLSSGASADVRSDGVAKDAEAAVFSSETVSPVRATARYDFPIEATSRLRGMEEALAADLRSTLGDKLDKLALNGQAAVANTSPAVEGLIAQLTAPADPGAISGWADFVKAYSSRVDGLYSADGSNVRLLVNPDAWQLAATLQINASGELLMNTLPSGRFRASANMPDPVSNVSTAITYAAGPHRGLIQPVWRSASIIRDPYTNASSGRVALTIVMLTGAVLANAAPYKLVAFQSA